jgi:flagellar biosynthesis protein FliQ
VDTAQLAAVIVSALELALLLSLPIVAASLLAGLFSGVLQAATQVQDPALGFVPKLAAVALALTLCAGWIGGRVLSFATRAFSDLARLLG